MSGSGRPRPAPRVGAESGGPRRLVIGVGNPDRGDDAAGRLVARGLRERSSGTISVRECSGEATALMEAWSGFDDVLLVDACRGAGAPGSVHRLEADQLERLGLWQRHRQESTHSFGVSAAIALARALGTLPSRVVVYAIEAAHFRDAAGLSPEVRAAVEKTVALLASGEDDRG